VEKAATAKIFFECHYNDLFSKPTTPRSLRRRELEGLLYDDITKSPVQKNETRKRWAQNESNHLRELRVMKTRSKWTLTRGKKPTSLYETVKVLGKGSFGVVRLVRERPENEYLNSSAPDT
jgi:protein-serine/threonine kinase